MIDITNTDPLYWERILSESNLSEIKDPEPVEISVEEFKELTNTGLLPEEDYKHEDDPVVIYNGITKDADTLNADHSGLSETNAELRGKVDGDDPFFEGHRIIKPRRGNRKCPEWAADNTKLRKVLLLAFPKLETNAKQRAKAGRWARIIQLYFRSQMTNGQVAHELKMSIAHIDTVLRAIRRAAAGLRANGSGKRTRNVPVSGHPIASD